MQLRSAFVANTLSMYAAVALLAACGGGDSAPPIDIAGAWVGDESASGGASGLMLTVGDTAYGFQTIGTTVRYFKGSAYGSDSVNYTFSTSRYDDSTAGSATATASVNGQLIGKFVDGASPRRLFVTYAATGMNNFFPMRMDTPPANVAAVADLRDFAGSYVLPAGNLTLTAGSATTATLSGTGVNGCSVSGTLSQPRADRNVWAVRLNQSACTDAARNGIATNGLGMLYKSGATLNISLIGEDGRAWTLIASSR